MPIHDLAHSPVATHCVRCEFCIIGGGAAGMLLASQLAQYGRDVVLLEAGPKIGCAPSVLDFVPDFLEQYYPGAVEGRSLGLGGSTSRWGGLLVPHSDLDLPYDNLNRDYPVWQHVNKTVSENATSVLKILGYPFAPKFSEYAHDTLRATAEAIGLAGLGIQASLFIPFRSKNLAHLVYKSPHLKSNLNIWINSVTCCWEVPNLTHRPTVQSIEARSSNGKTLKVEATRFILAAGTIESARILLEIQSNNPHLNLSREIGKNLGDHLSIPIGTVAPQSRIAPQTLFAPRFHGAWMRSFRFLAKMDAKMSSRSFAHFVFDNQNSGFQLAKKVLGGIQAKRMPSIRPSEFISGASGIIALGFQRFFRNRLFIPKSSPVVLQLDIEQIPSPDNFIALAGTKDLYGRRKASIHWSISDADCRNIEAASSVYIGKWNSIGSTVPHVQAISLKESSQKPHDAYHPVGTSRMGNDQDAVLDLNLKVNGISNLWNVTTGAFPSAGTANPTFSMLCMAHALLENLTTGKENDN